MERGTRNDVLSQHKLMEVAMGGKPDGVDEIVDIPLASIPRLPPGSLTHGRVETRKGNEERAEIQRSLLAERKVSFASESECCCVLARTEKEVPRSRRP